MKNLIQKILFECQVRANFGGSAGKVEFRKSDNDRDKSLHPILSSNLNLVAYPILLGLPWD